MDPPNVEIVRKIILHLITGRRIIGYHISQKLKEFQILSEATSVAISLINFTQSPCYDDNDCDGGHQIAQNGFLFDCAHMFTDLNPIFEKNVDLSTELKNCQTQLPFDNVCQRFIGLKWRKRRNQPYAYIESKVSMALYQRWRVLNGLKFTEALLNGEGQKSIDEVLSKPLNNKIEPLPVKPKQVLPQGQVFKAKDKDSKIQVFSGLELESFI